MMELHMVKAGIKILSLGAKELNFLSLLHCVIQQKNKIALSQNTSLPL